MAKEERDAVADFLVRRTSPELVEGLTVLAGLDLPVHDERSFRDQVDEIANERDDDAGVEAVRGRFGARDFPILSVESAFEKLWEAVRPRPPRVPLPELELPEEPPEFSTPPICEVYRDAFDPDREAADCACRAYARARRAGHSDVEAVIMGYSAGRDARETGRCPA